MPRKPKAKPSPAAPQQPQGSDSDAGPEQSTQTGQQPTASDLAASQAQHADSNAGITPNEPQAHGQQSTPERSTDAGNVPNLPPAGDSKFNHSHVRDRLQKHPDWKRIIKTVREMRLDPKIPPKGRERFIWSEMDRLYPPPKAQPVALLKNDSPQVEAGNDLRRNSEAPLARESGVKGLSDIPPDWPPLPGNAALAVELGWVQANRLAVVEELASGGTRVHLSRAHEPAPSRSAIGWLETSIRSYAKFVEVAAKVTGAGDEDVEQVKRERFQVEEIRELLREMAGNPTGPGR